MEAKEEWKRLVGGDDDDDDDDPSSNLAQMQMEATMAGDTIVDWLDLLPAPKNHHPFAQPTEQQTRTRAGTGATAQRFGLDLAQDTSNRMCLQGVGCGDAHTIVMSNTGAVYTFGSGYRGQLGHGDYVNQMLPLRVEALRNLFAEQVDAGGDHSVVLDRLGTVYTFGAGDNGQMGNGYIEDQCTPQRLQPIVHEEHKGPLALRKTVQKKDPDEEFKKKHPLVGIEIGEISCGGAHVCVLSADRTAMWTFGSGAYGCPEEQNPTKLSQLLKVALDDLQSKKVMVVTGILNMLNPHEGRFQDLQRQLILYGLYDEPVLSHILHKLLNLLVVKHSFVVMYAEIVTVISQHTLVISQYSFRMLLVNAVEDLGVRMLKAQEMWAQRHGLTGANATYFTGVQDRATLKDFIVFRRQLMVVQSFLEELTKREVVESTDLEDLAAGCPGSQHSIGIRGSVEAQGKYNLFRQLVPGGGASPEKGGGLVAAAVGEQESVMYYRATEEAAWDTARLEGWEGFLCRAEEASAEGHMWSSYLQGRREAREADEERWQEAAMKAKASDGPIDPVTGIPIPKPGETTGLKGPAGAARPQAGAGVPGQSGQVDSLGNPVTAQSAPRIMESTLCASTHPFNHQPTTGRKKMDVEMYRDKLKIESEYREALGASKQEDEIAPR